jgi:hypothetical protein
MGFLMQEAQKLIQPLDKTLKTMAIEFAESQVASSLYLQVPEFYLSFHHVI